MSQYSKSDPASIQKMFGSIARNYDKTNAVLSFGLHKWWNNNLVKHVCFPHTPSIIADLCCGTGEIAFSYLKKTPAISQAYLIDFCKEMLDCAEMKAKALNIHHHIEYLQADVQKLPLPDNFIQAATMAYGIRNVKDSSLCIGEVFRVLKPGGKFAILELTTPSQPLLRFGHSVYLQYILPILGKWLTSDKEAYTYLCQSIHQFIQPHALEKIFLEQGFINTVIKPLHGGIATIISGQKAL